MFLLPNIVTWLLPSPDAHSLLNPVVLFLTFPSIHPCRGLRVCRLPLYPLAVGSGSGRHGDAEARRTGLLGLGADLQRRVAHRGWCRAGRRPAEPVERGMEPQVLQETGWTRRATVQVPWDWLLMVKVSGAITDPWGGSRKHSLIWGVRDEFV